jgi:lipoate-protein ligase A
LAEATGSLAGSVDNTSANLLVFSCPGDVLSIGRYHIAPNTPTPVDATSLLRRFSGGRALPFGDGFVGISLVLPHRSALFSDHPLALAPYQVPNRYVRGILEGCKSVNIMAFYPGRDLITVGRRAIGLISFEINSRGALLVEVLLATHRDFSELASRLEAIDPAGLVKAEMLSPDDTTCLARELGVALTLEEVADMVRGGFERQFGLHCELRPMPCDVQPAVDSELSNDHWIRQRCLRPSLTHHTMELTQLGMFEAYFNLDCQGMIEDVLFAGDFIANSAAINQLEHALRGCVAEPEAIDSVVTAVFSRPENFILGIGPTHTIAATICKGVPA